jgi:heparin/heparan-sulfate lyase
MLQSTYQHPPILPPNEHPRLMLRAGDLARVRQNAATPSVATAQLKRLLAASIHGVGATPESGSYHLFEYLAAEARAFAALLSREEKDARYAIDTLLFLLRGAHYDSGNMKARYSGHLIFIAAEVYDWCYQWLTQAEREEIIARCEAFAAQHFEMGYPPARQAAISGHGNEAQLLRDLFAFSVAVYDERPDIYEFCAGRLFEEYLPAYEQVFAGEFHPQGPCYGSYRYISAMWFGLMVLAMSGERVLPASMARMPDSLLYLTRSDGEALRLGDDYNELKAAYTAKNPFAVPMFLAAAYCGNRRYYEEGERQMVAEYLIPLHYGMDYYDEGSCGEGLISPVSYLVFKGLTSAAEAVQQPHGRYFGSPVGCTVYNDGERLVLMKIGELWGANHDHLDTGCFQIYDGEILASDSGVYDSYNTSHRKQYLIHTLAHNCLLVNGQGTRMPNGTREPKTLEQWRAEYGMAKVTAHSESETLYMIEGDMTEAYAEQCRSVTRRMSWEPQRGERGVLTVEDMLQLKEAGAATFLLHCQSEPQVMGNEILICGKQRDLRCRILTPAAFTVDLVGGEGRQFEANGVQYEPQVRTAESGWGRIEITAKGEEVRFCVELEICKK